MPHDNRSWSWVAASRNSFGSEFMERSYPGFCDVGVVGVVGVAGVGW